MTDKIERNVKKVAYQSFQNIAKQLELKETELFEAIGQTRSVASACAKRAWVSKTAYLAAEGLLRRSRKKATSSTLLLVTIPNGRLEMFQELAGGLGFKVVHICEEV